MSGPHCAGPQPSPHQVQNVGGQPGTTTPRGMTVSYPGSIQLFCWEFSTCAFFVLAFFVPQVHAWMGVPFLSSNSSKVFQGVPCRPMQKYLMPSGHKSAFHAFLHRLKHVCVCAMQANAGSMAGQPIKDRPTFVLNAPQAAQQHAPTVVMFYSSSCLNVFPSLKISRKDGPGHCASKTQHIYMLKV
jgi:hypothetical protein